MGLGYGARKSWDMHYRPAVSMLVIIIKPRILLCSIGGGYILNHKEVLCRKTLTTGRLLTEISPYATWSSTLPWIVLVLTSSCIFFLASFRFSALFRSGHFAISGSLHQQFEMEYHQTSDCSLPFPASQPIEFCDFLAFESFLSGLD